MDLTLENVSYTYGEKSPFAHQALKNISLHIPSGRFIGIIGHTGSGKSTLIQLCNGLLQPTQGTLRAGEWTLPVKRGKGLHLLRQKVGMVFQYPEYQLFEETVRKDIAYGLENMDYPKELISLRVNEALGKVGLDPEEVRERSPFSLSGGQMRRVALAGILVLNPEVLILDEPTAGLDPAGKRQILQMIAQDHREEKRTTILVTHSMEDAALYCDYLYVLHKGTIYLEGEPRDVFRYPETIRQVGLDLPEITQFIMKFNEKMKEQKKDIPPLPLDIFKIEQLVEEIEKRVTGKRGRV